MREPLRKFLSRVPAKESSEGSGQFTAHCTAHDDRTPSLSISEAPNGRLLVNCHAKCEYGDIMRGAGLNESDGFPDDAKGNDWNPWKDGHEAAVYPYVDEKGKALFEVVRFEVDPGHPAYPDKTFIQRVPGKGWGRKKHGVEPVLFRLPKVIEKAARGRVVFVVEGEKDVLTLENWGLTATTCPQGADEWKDRFSEALEGAVVVIIGDNDDAGREHTKQVAASVLPYAKSVRIVELPDLPHKGDVTDWKEEYGGTREELERLVRDTPELTAEDVQQSDADVQQSDADVQEAGEDVRKTSAEVKNAHAGFGVLASDVEREVIRWLWKGRLALGEPTIFDGDPGLGKSTMLAELCARITSGRALPGDEGMPSAPADIVYVTTEDSPSHTVRPRLEAAGANLDRCLLIPHVPDEEGNPRPFLTPLDLPALREEIVRRGMNVALFVLDPLMAHLPPEINSHNDQDVRSALAPLAMFAHDTGAAVAVVRHLNKMSGGNSLYRGGGSIGIIGAFRIGLLMGKDPQDEDRLVLAHNKNNLARPPSSLAFRLEQSAEIEDVACVQWEKGACSLSAQDLLSAPAGRPDEAVSNAEGFLIEELADGPKLSREVHEAREGAGISKRTLYRAKDNLGVISQRIPAGSGPWYMELPNEKSTLPSSAGNVSAGNVESHADTFGNVAHYARNGDNVTKPVGTEGQVAKSPSFGNVAQNAGNGDSENGLYPHDINPGGAAHTRRWAFDAKEDRRGYVKSADHAPVMIMADDTGETWSTQKENLTYETPF